MYKIYSRDKSLEKIKILVDQFDVDFGGKKNPQMKEAQLENKYLKPFFSYLNWNIHNEGLSKGREEFRVQTSHRIKKSTKKPDYELWLPDKETNKMKRHFFMEAKNPKYDLHKEVKYMRQAYQYAHSTLSLSDHYYNHTRLSLLTDFEEFRLFDCLDPYPLTKNDAVLFNKYIIKPFDLNYQDYEKEFTIIWDTFERNNVINGSLSKFNVTDNQLKKNRIAPDLQFLDDLKKWRLDIARSMYKSNKDVSNDFLTTASQIIINRIIFLKMLTDREIERDYLTIIIEKISKEKEEISIYESCREIFEELNKKYNGDIFRKREELDYVKIENKVFQKIIYSLKPEKSIYNLSVMPIEIIGNVYEQFLGEVIVHKGKGISSEQKPEVRKAGGVYYTPRYIVDYIVENTVKEKLKECRSPNSASRLKILDPACGSGSFLLGVYDYILKWYINYYKKQIDKMLQKGKDLYIIKRKYQEEVKLYSLTDSDNKSNYIIHLTSKLKKSILLNNIYGVDIDENAVEITKFSLSMKALENSTREEVYEDVDLFNERLLPDLKDNIKCGNSLIGTDIYSNVDLFDNKKMQKINPFDWDKEFKEIMDNGGFDCVIGNPPYVTFSLGRGRTKTDIIDIKYLLEKWKNSTDYKINSFALFYELSCVLTNNNGYSSFIVPGTILINKSLAKIRAYLITKNYLKSYLKIDYKVFKDAEMGDCAIFIILKNKKGDTVQSLYSNNKENIILDKLNQNIVSLKSIMNISDYRFLLSERNYNFFKQKNNQVKLSEYCSFYNGIKTGNNKKFLSDNKDTKKHYPVIRGRDFTRYSDISQTIYVLFDKNKLWSNHDEKKLLKNPKIIIRQTSDKITATIDTHGYLVMDTIHIIYESKYNMYFLLGIINSKAFNYYHKIFVPETGKTFAEVKIANLKKICIPKITDKKQEFKITELVNKMLKAQKQYHLVKTDHEKKIFENQIDAIDRQIDSLVYELYELNEDDIKLIESNL